jgi:hypothetical protein
MSQQAVTVVIVEQMVHISGPWASRPPLPRHGEHIAVSSCGQFVCQASAELLQNWLYIYALQDGAWVQQYCGRTHGLVQRLHWDESGVLPDCICTCAQGAVRLFYHFKRRVWRKA